MASMSATGFARYADLPPAVREMAEHFGATNPFMCGTWLREFEARLLKSNEQPCYVVVADDEQPRLMLPLIIETHRWLRVAKVRSMANFYTNIYAPVTSAGFEADDPAAIAQTLTDYLVDSFPRAALIELSPLRGETRLYAAMIDAFAAHGYATRRFARTTNWHEPFTAAPSYDAYLAQRPGQLRSTLKRKSRLLERETQARIDITGPGGDRDTALSDFERVYADSWKPEESHPEFIRAVMKNLIAADRARAGILYVDEEPAAAQIWLRIGDHWGVFKLSYRPRFAKYSVGSLLTAAMIEEFLRMPDTRCIDFLSGDDAYKADWVSVKGEHWGFECINTRSPWGKLLSWKRRLSNTSASNTP
jgi:hypothetical protein